MTNDEFDIDADIPEEAEENLPAEKPSLKEVWEKSPVLKLAALALVGAISVGGYTVFSSKNAEEIKSQMNLSSDALAKQVPGQNELDPAYKQALEQENKKRVEEAAQSGGSALPTPIGTAKSASLDVPMMPEKLNSDPLAEWRKATEGRPVTPSAEPAPAPVVCADDLSSDKDDEARRASRKAMALAILADAKTRTVKTGTVVETELRKMSSEREYLANAKKLAPAGGIEEYLAKAAAKEAAAQVLVEDSKRRAAKEGDAAAQELEKMSSEGNLISEAKGRAQSYRSTIERELEKIIAEAGGDDAKRKLVDDAIRNMNADNGAALPDQPPMLQPARPQVQASRPNPKDAQALAEQMRVIVAAQAPSVSRQTIMTNRPSAYTEQQLRLQDAARFAQTSQDSLRQNVSASSGDTVNGSQDAQAPVKTIVPAGTIAYVQLLNALDSDVNGPVLAQILSGPFAGGRALGKVDTKQGPSDYMVLSFTTIVKDAVSYKINGIALDEKTTLAGHATDIDHHYFTRIILPAAAKFIEGYGSAVAQTATTTTQTSGGGQATSQPIPSPKQSIYKGIEEASKQASEKINQDAERPVTVKVAKGTTMGLLFINSVTTGDAGK